MKFTNKDNLSPCWVEAAQFDDYVKLGWRSVTGLINPVQVTILCERYDERIEVDVGDRLDMFQGNAMHALLARVADPKLNAIEEQFTIWVLDKEISLTPDRLTMNDEDDTIILTDYKYTTVWKVKFKSYDDYERQVNMYGYACRLQDKKVTRLVMELFMKDWNLRDFEQEQISQEKKGYSCDYPSTRAVSVPIRVWSDERCKTYLEARIKLYMEAETLPDNQLPECSPEDRWMKNEKWAVKKIGGKKAKAGGVCDTEFEAKAFIAGIKKDRHLYEIEHREGQNTRCERYCSAKPFCHQYNTKLNPAF